MTGAARVAFVKAVLRFTGLIGALGLTAFMYGAGDGGIESRPMPKLVSTDGQQLILARSEWLDSPASKADTATLHLRFEYFPARQSNEEPGYLLPAEFPDVAVVGHATLYGQGGDVPSVNGPPGMDSGGVGTVDLYFDLPAETVRLRTLRIETTVFSITRWQVLEFPRLNPNSINKQFQIGRFAGRVSGTSERLAISIEDFPFGAPALASEDPILRFMTEQAVGNRMDVKDANGVDLTREGVAGSYEFLFGPGFTGEAGSATQMERIAFPITVRGAIPDDWESRPLEFSDVNFEIPPSP